VKFKDSEIKSAISGLTTIQICIIVPSLPSYLYNFHLQEVDEIKFESYARIEHELTGRWLHALKDVEYVPRGTTSAFESLRGIECDDAELHKVC
jgi:hypothetical protein